MNRFIDFSKSKNNSYFKLKMAFISGFKYG